MERPAAFPIHANSQSGANTTETKEDDKENDINDEAKLELETASPPDEDQEAAMGDNEAPLHRIDSKPYSVFTHGEKRLIIFCAGVCSFLSPISAQIYFPALNQISADLGVSYDLVNLTITTYLVSRSFLALLMLSRR